MKNKLTLLVLLALISCQDQVSDLTSDQGYDFFPVGIGQVRIYTVREIYFQEGTGDTLHYFLRE